MSAGGRSSFVLPSGYSMKTPAPPSSTPPVADPSDHTQVAHCGREDIRWRAPRVDAGAPSSCRPMVVNSRFLLRPGNPICRCLISFVQISVAVTAGKRWRVTPTICATTRTFVPTLRGYLVTHMNERFPHFFKQNIIGNP